MYQQGTAKEMKKWAYEIHSSFLVPGAVSIVLRCPYFSRINKNMKATSNNPFMIHNLLINV